MATAPADAATDVKKWRRCMAVRRKEDA